MTWNRSFFLAVLFPLACIAHDWRNPDATFTTKSNFTHQTTVTWLVVDNVQRTCERESHKRGLGGFGYGVDACSFWRKNTCLIVTGKQTTHAELGHELRHCYQGSFHP